MSSNKPLVLVDGSSYLFRAFHALPPLVTSSGQATGAIKGVISMMRSLIRSYPDSHIAVVFDAKGKTFRNDLYADYKANRPPMPDDLRSQIEPIHRIIKAMGVPILMVDNVEADDVIATLALRATETETETLISTGDKDLAQLVNEHVSLLNTMTNEFLDIEGVTKKFGLPPERIVDFLALTGDKSDNIPGVPGVGPKTAVKWLQEYGSIESLVEHADFVKGKIGERLRENIDQLWLSHELATVKRDVPLDLRIEELRLGEQDQDELFLLFDELEFRAWVKELEDAGAVSDSARDTAAAAARETVEEALRGGAAVPGAQTQVAGLSDADLASLHPEQVAYNVILSDEGLQRCLTRLRGSKRFALALETDGAHFMEAAIIGLSVSMDVGEAYYIPLGHDSLEAAQQLDRPTVMKQLQPILEDKRIHKIGHDCKSLRHLLANYGIDFAGYKFDTLLASYVLNSVAIRHQLASVARHYLDVTPVDLESLLGKGRNKLSFSQLDIPRATEYAAQKADLTLRLGICLNAKLNSTGQLSGINRYYEIPLVHTLQKMERCGILVDGAVLGAQSHELTEKLLELEKKAYELAGEEFNLGSPRQLQQIFYEKLNLPILKKTPKGQPSTAEPVLAELALDYELPKLILDQRGLSKLKSTYTDKLPLQINKRTGRIHSSFQQAVAATGRLSSTEPNLQNIPIRSAEGRRIRQAFVPKAGYKLVAADYSQVELRIMAHLSQDAGLLKAFSEAQDVHRATAAEVFGIPLDEVSAEQRRRAKAINFGLIYGMSAFGLAKQLGIGRGDAQEYVNRYFERYPGVAHYMDQTKAQATELGYVETLFGRRLYLPDINAANGMLRKAAQRTAINAPMQGSAADIIKQAMIDIDHWLDTGAVDASLLLQVHDELVFEVAPADIQLLREGVTFRMVTAASLDVPLVVDIGVGDNWDEAH